MSWPFYDARVPGRVSMPFPLKSQKIDLELLCKSCTLRGKNLAEDNSNTWRRARLNGEKLNRVLRVLMLFFEPLYRTAPEAGYLVKCTIYFLFFFVSQFNVSLSCTVEGVLADV